MILEIYTSGDEIPALYDVYLDKAGSLWFMCPAPPHTEEIVQLVMERDFITPNKAQAKALEFISATENVEQLTFFPANV